MPIVSFAQTRKTIKREYFRQINDCSSERKDLMQSICCRHGPCHRARIHYRSLPRSAMASISCVEAIEAVLPCILIFLITLADRQRRFYNAALHKPRKKSTSTKLRITEIVGKVSRSDVIFLIFRVKGKNSSFIYAAPTSTSLFIRMSDCSRA